MEGKADLSEVSSRSHLRKSIKVSVLQLKVMASQVSSWSRLFRFRAKDLFSIFFFLQN